MTRTEPEALKACHEALQPFRNRGFRDVAETYDSQHFGNVLIDLQSPDLRLRLTRDRSQHFIDISSPTDNEWFDTHTVLSFLGACAEADDLAGAGWPSPYRVAELVDKYLEPIVAAFGEGRYAKTKQAMHAIESQRTLERFGY